ncbi:PRS2 protein [Marinobacter santoriniensis NKSG1]|uniref:PRS2 protein n=1 Tax=Marinobacter santoriniensis NKSG1 TaxID=1288826 RepID=M7DIH9_9GAMM|nr:Mpo1-like protein [Marinobacter santoriniensis]EMP57467.1 PRS2 protein [Marinobacter santoriniensis NKSG1]
MRSLEQFLNDYGESHQNPFNQWVHIVCVPAILISTLGLLWLVPLGRWLGLEGSAAEWVNGATLLAALSAIVYVRLSIGVLVLMTGWFALSAWVIQAVLAAGWSLLWTSLAVFVVAWIIQVYGHKVEGKKPSFVEDLVFLLIGPIFVSVEFAAKLGLPVPYAQSHRHDGPGGQPQGH